jgi:lipopolysaccharide exporter
MSSAPPSLTRKATSGVAWSAVFQVGRQLLSIVSVFVLAHFVPPGAYGVVAMAVICMNFLETFRDLGTTNALVREPDLTDALISSIFWLNCILGTAVTLCMVLVSVPVAAFFHEPQLSPVVRALSVTFFLNALGVVPTALLNREMSFRNINVASFAGAVVGTALSIAMAIRGAGVWSLVAGTLTSTAVNTVAVWTLCPWRVQWVLKWKPIRSIASYTLHLSGFNILNYLSRNADNLIVGRFLGDISLGHYQMAYTVMTYPLSTFSSVICQVLFPAMSQVHDDNVRFRRAFIRTCMLISLFTFPMMLGLTVTARPLVYVVLGEKWLPVGGLLTVFGPLGMVQSITTVAGIIYNAKGRTDLMFRWGVTSSILFVLSFFIGLRWGIMGVATSYAIMFALLLVPGLVIPFRLIELSLWDFCKHLWPVLKASLLMTAVVAAWMAALRWLGVTSPHVTLFSSVAVGAVTYILLLLWWAPPALVELRNISETSGNSILARAARWLPSVPAASMEGHSA